MHQRGRIETDARWQKKNLHKNTMQTYTVGFIFNPSLERVLLIEKLRPAWQKGKLNGIGGKIEPNEESAACVAREAHEECGLATKKHEWTPVVAMQGPDWAVDVYAHVYAGNTTDAITKEDEKVEWFDVAALPAHTMTNLPWMIHLAVDKLKNDEFHHCVVRYK